MKDYRVYVRNLKERIPIPKLKETLQTHFSKYGNILSITAHKNLKMKGQAFIAFDNIESAKKSILELNGLKLFEQKIELKFSKKDSDFVIKNKFKNEDDKFNEYLKKRKADKIKREEENNKNNSNNVNNNVNNNGGSKKKRKTNANSKLPANKILFIENLPNTITQDKLVEIFGKYKGFLEVRLVSIRKLAFIEYENDEEAIVAKKATEDLLIDGAEVLISYAKK